MHIIIDIGHARGTGASGNGMQEHERCALIAAALAEKLRGQGPQASVLDYPDKSNRADLAATAAAANRISGPCIGISLHMDAASRPADPAPHGAHVCYASAAGKRLAEAIAEPLCALLPGRATKTVRRTDLYILNNTRCVWALAECGFITNPGDAATDPAAVAHRIAEGINRYLGT